MIPHLGSHEYLFVTAVGTAVGVAFSLLRRFDQKKPADMLVALGTSCGLLGAVGLVVLLFDDLAAMNQLPFVMMLGGGPSVLLGTPLSLAIWFVLTRHRRS